MKRSEMIEKLSRALICPHVILEPGIENHFVPKAEYILDLLEKSGMLPPFVDHWSVGPNKDYFTLHVSDAAYSGLCEWEKE
jgi:hypothetical protein